MRAVNRTVSSAARTDSELWLNCLWMVPPNQSDFQCDLQVLFIRHDRLIRRWFSHFRKHVSGTITTSCKFCGCIDFWMEFEKKRKFLVITATAIDLRHLRISDSSTRGLCCCKYKCLFCGGYTSLHLVVFWLKLDFGSSVVIWSVKWSLVQRFCAKKGRSDKSQAVIFVKLYCLIDDLYTLIVAFFLPASRLKLVFKSKVFRSKE